MANKKRDLTIYTNQNKTLIQIIRGDLEIFIPRDKIVCVRSNPKSIILALQGAEDYTIGFTTELEKERALQTISRSFGMWDEDVVFAPTSSVSCIFDK